ncbi:MAG: DUF4013 domain-containing protein [Euryarchaeota archaeon]|nr:DUF4013 domain-containing protein [Euryarchaeota archaeon]
MALYAIDNLDDAWAATREFLTPFSVKRLLVLAVVVFFVGGTGMNFPGSGASSSPETEPGTEPNPDLVWGFLVENALAVGLVGGAVLLLVLGFMFVGALMEFVFVQSLRTDEVRFWRYSRNYLGKGFRLLGFRLALSLIWILPSVAFLGFVLTGVNPIPEIGGAVLIVLVLLAILLFVLSAVVDAFTTAFVVPVMLVRESGVLGGWRAFWPTLKSQWKQYLAYAIAALVLTIAAGILAVILVGVVFVVLGIPVFLVAAAAVAVGGESVFVPIFAVAVAVLIGAVVLTWLLVQVPIQTYLRYYALLILGDTDQELDPIPEIRASVRKPAEGRDSPETI